MSEPTVTYTWKIERLDCAPLVGTLESVVCRIHWRLLATDGTNITDTYGDIGLCDPDPQAFVTYPSLTEATVLTWLEAAIDARAAESDDDPTVAQLRTGLAGILAARRTPTVVPMELPWQ